MSITSPPPSPRDELLLILLSGLRICFRAIVYIIVGRGRYVPEILVEAVQLGLIRFDPPAPKKSKMPWEVSADEETRQEVTRVMAELNEHYRPNSVISKFEQRDESKHLATESAVATKLAGVVPRGQSPRPSSKNNEGPEVEL